MVVYQITPEEFERLKTLCYHAVVQPSITSMAMDALRTEYIHLALSLLRSQAPSRSQSLALTHLEDSLMRGVQALALQGKPQLPSAFEVIATP